MFAQVMRAKVLKGSNDGEKVGQEVAIKVIRSQESM
jgi:predicted unusual protein kinase regulating ubiquinone biosynthesis (AarF/ABC1/UbiB family)